MLTAVGLVTLAACSPAVSSGVQPGSYVGAGSQPVSFTVSSDGATVSAFTTRVWSVCRGGYGTLIPISLPDVSASTGGEVELVNPQPDYTTTWSMTFNGQTATGKATFVVGLCGGTTPFTATRS